MWASSVHLLYTRVTPCGFRMKRPHLRTDARIGDTLDKREQVFRDDWCAIAPGRGLPNS